jgi:hypothetical protein
MGMDLLLSKRPTTDMKQGNQVALFGSVVRIIVKMGASLQIITAVFVIGMGVSTRHPDDLFPNLVWEGVGYRYDLVETFGNTTTSSFEFFYLILSTMMATILQTLCSGIWILASPLSSQATSDGLNAGIIGVPLIILANILTIAIYQQENSDFTTGRKCMIAHILLLLHANLHLPIVWGTYRIWKHFTRRGASVDAGRPKLE